ncbi:MAG: glycosyltransferase family 4 protein [Cyclobacteriaceae bacterium]|nr:glycosyltransferase family 4 protein [Cyclobacteriaceae bacterium]MCH8516912.1 glycosyltransferase family 4 protein [Cyclobacteriaceae bacterium]
MKIWFISKYEQTPFDHAKSSRFQTIAEFAADRGHDVKFITSTFKHNTKSQRFNTTTIEKISPNYELVFLKSASYKKNVGIKRILEHAFFARTLINYLKKAAKPDVVLISYPPIGMVYKVADWCTENNIPFVVDIIDPWPEVFISKLNSFPVFIQSFILSGMRNKAKKIFNQASRIHSISQQYLDWSRNYHQHNRVACYYPARKFSEMQSLMEMYRGQEDRKNEAIRIIYAGSFGISYDIPTMIKVAEECELRFDNKVQFVFCGAGTQQRLVENAAKKLKNFKYLGRLPKDQLLKEYAFADLGFTQHTKGATQSVTYKLFDLLSCGIPILNSLESEMKDIIIENQVGFHNAPGDYLSVVINIESLLKDRSKLYSLKENAIKLTKSKGDSEVVYNSVVNELELLGRLNLK